jgi:hypothetical protein
MATIKQREALTSAHHHTPLFRADHVTAIIAIGALLWIIGAAFAISWRHSGDKLRGILSEFDNHGTPAAEQGSGFDVRPADPVDGGVSGRDSLPEAMGRE